LLHYKREWSKVSTLACFLRLSPPHHPAFASSAKEQTKSYEAIMNVATIVEQVAGVYPVGYSYRELPDVKNGRHQGENTQ